MWCAGDKDPPAADEGTQCNRTNATMKLGERTGTMTVLESSNFDEARGNKASCSSSRNSEKEQRRKPDHQSALYGG